MAITGSFSVYYKYTDDIKVLLGSYTKPSSSGGSGGGSGGSSPPTYGIYEQKPGVYTMYKNGSYVYKGAITFNKSLKSTEFVFEKPFVNTDYNVKFDKSDVEAYGISVAGRYVDRFTANCAYPPVDDSLNLTIQFDVDGRWM